MRTGLLALAALLTLAVAACSDSTTPVYPDKGPGLDQPVITETGPGSETGPGLEPGKPGLEPGGPGKEAGVPDVRLVDLPILPEGSVTDGPKPEATVTDGPKTEATVTDGPKTDNPQILDAPKDEGPKPEGPKPEGPKPEGPKPADGPAPVINDAGKYVCVDASGTHLCRCNDGLDNDNDGKIDTADPCCKSASGDWEGGYITNGQLNMSQCTNCIDDDSDGQIDAADSACMGPMDNDEATFGTGIPGDNMDPCRQDCFFDGNSGAGDDKCDWNLKCDPKDPGSYLKKSNGDPLCPYDPKYKNCPTTVDPICIQKCQKVTPNGCDCFGCCEVWVSGTKYTVMLSPTCTLADAADPNKCPPCTFSTLCGNPCGTCEICLGKPTLPPECFPDSGPPPPTCCCGYTSCAAAGSTCPVGTYCITGCCVPIE